MLGFLVESGFDLIPHLVDGKISSLGYIWLEHGIYFLFYTILICLFLLGIFILFSQIILWPADLKAPPICSSWTLLGPLSFFRNPMEFSARKRKEFQSNIFSSFFIFHRVTFVFGEANVAKVTSAENSVLNFEQSYAPFLGAAFGANMLTAYTIEPQVEVLKKYLTYNHLQDYVIKSAKLGSNLLKEKLGSSGKCDLIPVLRDIVFHIGTRNFLGDDFLRTLSNYDFNTIFSGFEQTGFRVIANFLFPQFLLDKMNQAEIDRYAKAKTDFEESVLALAEEKKLKFSRMQHSHSLGDLNQALETTSTFKRSSTTSSLLTSNKEGPSNMFEELVYRHSEKDGPTLADDQTLTNLAKLFVFGSSFNSYNLLCLVLTAFVNSPEKWQKLRDEQKRIGYDPEKLTQEKIAEMTLLHEEMMNVSSENAFPFLLRTAKTDFEVDGYIIPKGDIILWSPRINEKDSDNLLFGQGVHVCPAVKYAKNSMMVILSLFVYYYSFRPIGKIESFVNRRMITFSQQNSLMVNYKRS